MKVLAKTRGIILWIQVLFETSKYCNSECPTFGEKLDASTVRCSTECFNDQGSVVYGSEIYSKDTSVCRAAIHAGIVDPGSTSADVNFQLVPDQRTQLTGSVNNRIVSKSVSFEKSQPAFRFSDQKWIPKDLNEYSWMTNVIMVHDGHNGKFSIKCLWENPTEGQRQMVRWNFKEILADFERSDDSVAIENSYGNFRAFNCLGRYPLTDGFGVRSREEDYYRAAKLTFRGIRGRPLTVNFTKHEFGLEVFMRKFPEQWNYTTSDGPDHTIPLHFTHLKKTDGGLYVVGKGGIRAKFHEKTLNGWSSYFQIIVRDCPEENYGRHCEYNCRECHNGGVCHSLIGACICMPGFYGESCERICAHGSFGSSCQFKCTQDFFPLSRTKRNCEGLIFCLPAPYGCSCASGYQGLDCKEAVSFEFPWQHEPPKVHLQTDDSVKVHLMPWSLEETHGFEIQNFRVKWGQIGGITRPQTHEVSSTETEYHIQYLYPDTIYQVEVKPQFKNYGKSLHSLNSGSAAPLNFSLPCFFTAEINLTEVYQEENMLRIAHKVPAKNVDFQGCNFELIKTTADKNAMGKAKICSNDTLDQWIFCQFTQLPSGQSYNISIWCKNGIGKCNPKNLSTFTLTDLSDYFNYVNYELSISTFYVFEQSSTQFQVLRLGKEYQNNNQEDFKIEKLLKKKAFKVLVRKEDLMYSESKRVYWISLSDNFKKETEPVKLAAILTYYDAKGKIKNAGKIFFSAHTDTTWIVITACVIFGTTLLLLIFIWMYKKKDKKPTTLKEFFTVPTLFQPNAPADDKKKSVNFCDEIITYENINCDQEPDYTDIMIGEDIELYLNGLIFSKEYEEQFQAIPKHLDKSSMFGKHPMNIPKNRYANVLPYDDSRVVLQKVGDDPFSDYINASHVKGIDPRKRYIATQGPKAGKTSTIKDFWRMIVEKDVDIIVMVANFEENKKQKVDHYFDVYEAMQIEDFAIIQVSERNQEPHFIYTVLEVFDVTGHNRLKKVIHYQFTQWPDHAVPFQILPLVRMVQNISKNFKEGTIVVHCSAGIGRSGTLLHVLLVKEAYHLTGHINPIETLKEMRTCRPRLVDNILQFNIALSIIYELLFGDVGLINTSDFETNYESHLREATALYKRLVKQPAIQNYEYGSDVSKLDYSNAIVVDVEDLYGAIIVTEPPLVSTIYDFWKMIVLRNSSHLFLLNPVGENQQYASIVSFEEEWKDYNGIQVNVTKLDFSESFSAQHYYAQVCFQDVLHSVNVFQLMTSIGDRKEKEEISLIERISRYILENAKNDASFVLCCSDGAITCGLFVCAVSIINRIQLYQEVNVYNSAMQIRRYIRQLIISEKQFKTLYAVAYEYLKKSNYKFS